MMDSGVPMTMNVEPAGTNNNGGLGWGGDGAWFLIILFLFMFSGWGNGFGSYGNGVNGAGFQDYATRADINEGFAMNNLQSGINAIQQGICDATYALNSAIRDGFSGVSSMICNLGSQLAQCCCDIRAAIQDVKFEMAQNTCTIANQINNSTRDILENQNNNARAILDKLCQMEYNGLNDKYQAALTEIQTLKSEASQTAQNAFIAANQSAQTAEIIRRLGADCPQPAFVVQPPQPVTFPTNCCGQYNGGWNNGCGNCGSC